MYITEFVSRLQKVRKHRNGSYLARCPAHPDTNPSLAVSLKNNKILLKCFTGCTAEAIVSSMGLTMQDLFELPLPERSMSKEYIKPHPAAIEKIKYSTEQPDEIEKTLLGSVILDNDLIYQLQAELDVSDMGDTRTSKVYSAMIQLASEGKEITPVLIHGLVKDVSLVWISSLITNIVPLKNLTTYVKIVKEKSDLQKLFHLGTYIEDAIIDGVDKSELLQNIQSRIDTIRASESEGFKSFMEVAPNVHQQIQDLRDGKNPAIATGIETLDKALRGGGWPGELTTLVAKTSKGKSSLAKQWVHYIAGGGTPVAVVTCEMTNEAVFKRILAPEAGVSSLAFQLGTSVEKLDALEEALPKVANLPVYIGDKIYNIYDLRAQITPLVKNKGIKVLFVDYLQLLGVGVNERTRINRTEEVAIVSRLLKRIAKELNIWVIALCQFNRTANAKDAEGREQELAMHQIAEAGQIERDSDHVLILDMEKYEPGTHERTAYIKIDKNRESVSDLRIPLIFHNASLTYREPNSPLILNRRDVRTKEMFEERQPEPEEENPNEQPPF